MTLFNRHIAQAAIAIFSATLFASCNTMAVRGSGNSYEVSHEIADIHSIHVKGNGELQIINGEQNQLIVFAQEELHQHLSIRETNNQLTIKPKDGYHFKNDQGLKYVLITNDLNYIDTSGAVNITGEKYQTETLHIDTSGASDVDLSVEVNSLSIDASGSFDGYLAGKANELILDFSGSSDLNAYDLEAQTVDIDISGASTTFVRASEQLNVSAAGASKVTYKGNPRVSHSSAGASSVNAAQ